MSGSCAVIDSRRPEILHCAPDVLSIEEIDLLPSSAVFQLLPRRRVVPGHELFAPGEQFDEVASGKTGCARDERRTGQRSGSILVLRLVVRAVGGVLLLDWSPPPLVLTVPGNRLAKAVVE